MKKRNLLALGICLFGCFLMPSLKADCSDTAEEEALANKVMVLFELQDAVHEVDVATGEEYSIVDQYDVTIKNIDERIYILINGQAYNKITSLKADSTGTFKYTEFGDSFVYGIYSMECDTLLREVKVYMPKYNEYREDKECNGLAEKSLKLCTEWIEEEDLEYFKGLDDEKFAKAISEAKANTTSFKIYNFLEGLLWYAVCPIAIVGIIFVVRLIIIKKRSKLE